MNLLNYSLAAVVVYAGLFAGFILAAAAKEELKSGKGYFILMEGIILLLILIFFAAFSGLGYIFLLSMLISALIFAVTFPGFLGRFSKAKKKLSRVPFVYILLSVLFYLSYLSSDLSSELSSKKPGLFAIESSLIFLYGLPAGSLAAKSASKKEMRNAMAEILKSALFIAAAVILFVVFLPF